MRDIFNIEPDGEGCPVCSINPKKAAESCEDIYIVCRSGRVEVTLVYKNGTTKTIRM